MLIKSYDLNPRTVIFLTNILRVKKEEDFKDKINNENQKLYLIKVTYFWGLVLAWNSG